MAERLYLPALDWELLGASLVALVPLKAIPHSFWQEAAAECLQRLLCLQAGTSTVSRLEASAELSKGGADEDLSLSAQVSSHGARHPGCELPALGARESCSTETEFAESFFAEYWPHLGQPAPPPTGALVDLCACFSRLYATPSSSSSETPADLQASLAVVLAALAGALCSPFSGNAAVSNSAHAALQRDPSRVPPIAPVKTLQPVEVARLYKAMRGIWSALDIEERPQPPFDDRYGESTPASCREAGLITLAHAEEPTSRFGARRTRHFSGDSASPKDGHSDSYKHQPAMTAQAKPKLCKVHGGRRCSGSRKPGSGSSVSGEGEHEGMGVEGQLNCSPDRGFLSMSLYSRQADREDLQARRGVLTASHEVADPRGTPLPAQAQRSRSKEEPDGNDSKEETSMGVREEEGNSGSRPAHSRETLAPNLPDPWVAEVTHRVLRVVRDCVQLANKRPRGTSAQLSHDTWEDVSERVLQAGAYLTSLEGQRKNLTTLESALLTRFLQLGPDTFSLSQLLAVVYSLVSKGKSIAARVASYAIKRRYHGRLGLSGSPRTTEGDLGTAREAAVFVKLAKDVSFVGGAVSPCYVHGWPRHHWYTLPRVARPLEPASVTLASVAKVGMAEFGGSTTRDEPCARDLTRDLPEAARTFVTCP